MHWMIVSDRGSPVAPQKRRSNSFTAVVHDHDGTCLPDMWKTEISNERTRIQAKKDNRQVSLSIVPLTSG